MTEIRARRHPAAIAGLWAWQTALALLFALPAASLAGAAFGGHPRGDAPLWDPGGRVLLDFLQRGALGLAPVTLLATIVLVVGVIGGIVPSAAIMFAMHAGAAESLPATATEAAADPGARRPWSRPWTALGLALARFPAFARLLVLVAVLRAALLGVGVGAGALVADGIAGPLGEGGAALFVGLAVAAALALGVAEDLARAILVRSGGRRAVPAFVQGWRALRREPWRVAWGWGWREALGWAAVLAAGAIAESLGGRGGLALLLLALVHQAVVALRACLRASWLARALRAVG